MGPPSRNREDLERELEANVDVVEIPRPNVNVTKTKSWPSMNSALLDPVTAITHAKLDKLADLTQAAITMLLDHGAKLKNLTAEVNSIKKALGGGSSPSTSRRSSFGSTSRVSSIDDGTEDEELDVLAFLDEFFENFVQGSSFKPLKKRTKNTLAAVQALVNAAQQSLSETVGTDTAEIVNEHLAGHDDLKIQELYVTLSKRYHAHKSEGKKVATVTDQYETDVERAGDNEESQSTTHMATPKPRRSQRVHQPQTPAPPRFGNVDDDVGEGSLFVIDDDDADVGERRAYMGDDSYLPGE